MPPMKGWVVVALLGLGLVLWLDGPDAEQSASTRSWAELRCQQVTDSVHASAACQAAVAEAHPSCLDTAYRPGARHRPSIIDRDHYWDCVAKADPVVPPRRRSPRLVLD